jgi:hypothetical protein
MSPLKQKTPIKGPPLLTSSVSSRLRPVDEHALRVPLGSGPDIQNEFRSSERNSKSSPPSEEGVPTLRRLGGRLTGWFLRAAFLNTDLTDQTDKTDLILNSPPSVGGVAGFGSPPGEEGCRRFVGWVVG